MRFIKTGKIFLATLIVLLSCMFIVTKTEAAQHWEQEGDEWYYYDDNGNRITGWSEINGHWYYFDTSDCQAVKGWQKINGKWQYFQLSGDYECAWVEDRTHNGMDFEAGTIKGIDVSRYQGSINWTEVRNEGINYVMIRVGYSNRNLDNNYEDNISGSNLAGIHTGVYFYSTAMSVEQSIGDAQWVIKQLRGYKVDYPVAIDLESWDQAELGRDEVTRIAKAFCDEIRAAGYTPMVYCNENWARSYVDFSKLDGVEKWIARYGYYYDTSITRGMWQAGSQFRLNGISSTFVDIDFATKDYSKIVTARKAPIASYTPTTGTWVNHGYGYWYQRFDGSYPYDQWEKIGGNWYYFNHDGYRQTGWILDRGTWYYLNGSGVMQTGWILDRGTWYYLNGSGAMQTGWLLDRGTWYYLNGSGAMQTGWLLDNGTWYYLNDNGAMATGWIKLGETWYYLNGSGAMQTGWLLDNGSWYYLTESGAMATNTYIDGYYVDGSGRWV